MLDSDLHDLSDNADYAVSQQQASASVMLHSDSTKQSSSSSERDDAEIVFLKDNVAIHPTQFRISGRLQLIKQGASLFMTWIPYKGNSSADRLSDKDRNLYTITAVPFTDIKSIRRHTPALGWQYIIVVLSSGLAYPPLYFYSGGVTEFLATIKQHVLLVRSAEDADVFLVNDFQNTPQTSTRVAEVMPQSSQRGFQAEKMWRLVGLVSSVVGMLCSALSDPFKRLIRGWNLFKFFCYLGLSLVICAFVLYAKRSSFSSQRKRYIICYVVFLIISVYSLIYDKAVDGKPGILSLVSNVAFALVSLSLSKLVDAGFDTGTFCYFLGCFTIQLLTINWKLILVAIIIDCPLFLWHFSSDSQPKVDYNAQAIPLWNPNNQKV